MPDVCDDRETSALVYNVVIIGEQQNKVWDQGYQNGLRRYKPVPEVVVSLLQVSLPSLGAIYVYTHALHILYQVQTNTRHSLTCRCCSLTATAITHTSRI